VTHNVGGATESIGEAAENRDRVITEPSKVIRAHHTTLRDRTDWDKPRKIRSLTMPETLVLQGFSPDYDLSVAKTQKARWTMVGNAVPPGVAEAVIRGIIQ
jgi:site-specific DNA-cytosine methylase